MSTSVYRLNRYLLIFLTVSLLCIIIPQNSSGSTGWQVFSISDENLNLQYPIYSGTKLTGLTVQINIFSQIPFCYLQLKIDSAVIGIATVNATYHFMAKTAILHVFGRITGRYKTSVLGLPGNAVVEAYGKSSFAWIYFSIPVFFTICAMVILFVKWRGSL